MTEQDRLDVINRMKNRRLNDDFDPTDILVYASAVDYAMNLVIYYHRDTIKNRKLVDKKYAFHEITENPFGMGFWLRPNIKTKDTIAA